MSVADVHHTAAAPSLRLLGPPALTLLHRQVAFTPERPFQLLAYLACRGGWVARDALAELLYPGRSLEAARSNLRKVLHLARRIDGVGPIEQHGELLRWQPDSDLLRFEQALREGRLEDAVALYGGPLLEGLDTGWAEDGAAWLGAERQRLAARWHEACARRLDQLATEPGEAAALAERVLRHDPLDEPAVLALAQAQVALGRQAAALDALADHARRLHSQLGMAPSLRLQALADALRGVRSSPPVPAMAGGTGSTGGIGGIGGEGSLIGRRHERAQLAERLSQPTVRRLTLLGVGGIGKTTLARAVCRAQAAHFAAGVGWVELGGAGPLALDALPPRIAAALGLALEPSSAADGAAWSALAHALAPPSTAPASRLLVLDNAEALVEQHGPTLAAALDTLLDAVPGLTLLITSRVALGGVGEHRLALEGLPLPDADETDAEVLRHNDAVRLFAQRARAVAPDFDLAREAAAVVQLVHAVDGLPLAIELLAPWRRLMPVQAMVQELAASLELLEGDGAPGTIPGTTPGAARGAADRSVRASFDRSWRMLGPAEQQALAAIALLPQPLGRALARQVLELPLSVLAGLVDRSLLRVDEQGRFTLHPLVRRCAAPRAAGTPEAAALRARHARAVAQGLPRPGSSRDAELAAVAAELDHVHAAWQWATEAVDAALLVRLAGPLQFHERHSGHWHTCIERFERAAAALRARMPADASTPRDAVEVQALARVLAGLADLRFAIGALDATAADAKACVELAPLLSDDAPVADAFMALNSVCWQRDQFDEAMVWVDRYLESAARSGQRLREAHGLTSRSLLFKELGRFEEALRDSHAARTLLHALGETAQLPTVLNNEGNLLRMMKRHDEAVEALREGLHWTHQHRMVRDRPWLLTNLAIALEDRACHDEAEATLREALADLEVNAEPFLHVFALLTLGRVRAARERRVEGAMQPVWQALALVDRVGFTWLRHDVVITAARIHRHAGEPRRAAALLQWVLGDADATAPCRQAARQRLDELDLDAAALADAARELPPETPIESVLARLPGRYANAARAGTRADATA